MPKAFKRTRWAASWPLDDAEGVWARLEAKTVRNEETGCLEWQGAKRANGYGVTSVDGCPAAAHRLAYAAKVQVIPRGMFVCHKCDNPSCINPDHLFLGDAEINSRDADKKGRTKLQGGPKLGKSEAQKIRCRLAAGATCAELVREYGVGPQTITNIKLNKTYPVADVWWLQGDSK